LLLAYMWAQPGKKLLFMGGEFGQGREWSHDRSLDWHLLEYDNHRGVQRWMQDLNAFYRAEPALWQQDFTPAGFEWVDANDNENSTLTFLRIGRDPTRRVLCAFNFTPVPRSGYRIGVPCGGTWQEVLNSDAPEYYGSGLGNLGAVEATPGPWHGRPFSLELTLPPLGGLFLRAPREVSS
jgi:1,4-alpha-glucan branching enzyme